MLRTMMLLLGSCVVLSLPLSAAMAQDSDLDRIQGEWRVVSTIWNDFEDATGTPRMRFEGDQWIRSAVDGTPVYTVTFQLDSSTVPPQIDAIYTFRNGEQRKTLGIYQWDGDELVINIDCPGGNRKRPESFDGTVGTNSRDCTVGAGVRSILWRLERVTEARPD